MFNLINKITMNNLRIINLRYIENTRLSLLVISLHSKNSMKFINFINKQILVIDYAP